MGGAVRPVRIEKPRGKKRFNIRPESVGSGHVSCRVSRFVAESHGDAVTRGIQERATTLSRNRRDTSVSRVCIRLGFFVGYLRACVTYVAARSRGTTGLTTCRSCQPATPRSVCGRKIECTTRSDEATANADTSRATSTPGLGTRLPERTSTGGRGGDLSVGHATAAHCATPRRQLLAGPDAGWLRHGAREPAAVHSNHYALL